MKSIFELAENLSLILAKLDTELGLAQPQLVHFINPIKTYLGFLVLLPGLLEEILVDKLGLS